MSTIIDSCTVVSVLVILLLLHMCGSSNIVTPEVGSEIVITYVDKALPKMLYSTVRIRVNSCYRIHKLSKIKCEGWSDNGDCPGTFDVKTTTISRDVLVKECTEFSLIIWKWNIKCSDVKQAESVQARYCALGQVREWFQKIDDEYYCDMDWIQPDKIINYRLINDISPIIITPTMGFKLSMLEYQSFVPTGEYFIINGGARTLEAHASQYMTGCGKPTLTKSYCDNNCGRSVNTFTAITPTSYPYTDIADKIDGKLVYTAKGSTILSIIGDNVNYDYNVYYEAVVCAVDMIKCKCATGSDKNGVSYNNKVTCTYDMTNKTKSCAIFTFTHNGATYGMAKATLENPSKLDMMYLSTIYNNTINLSDCSYAFNPNTEYGNYTERYTHDWDDKNLNKCDIWCILKWVGIGVAILVGAIIIIVILGLLCYGLILIYPFCMPVTNVINTQHKARLDNNLKLGL